MWGSRQAQWSDQERLIATATGDGASVTPWHAPAISPSAIPWGAPIVPRGLAHHWGLFDVAVVWAALTAFSWYAFALVPIQLATASQLGLDRMMTSSLLFSIWCTAGLGTLAFALITRQPVALGSQFPMLIYLATLADRFTFPQLMGGVLVAGLVVLLAGWLGLVGRVLRWIPSSITMAVFIGSVFGVLTSIVDACIADPLVAGATVGGYVLGCILRWHVVPAIGMAAIAGAVGAALGGRFTDVAVTWSLPTPALVPIEFAPAAVVTVAVPIVVFSLTAGPRGMAMLADQGYTVKIDRVVAAMGASTVVNALFGGGPAGLSNEGGAALAGPEAGAKGGRYFGAAIAGVLMLAIGVFAEPLAGLLQMLPRELMLALVGLALLRVVADGCRRMFGGPLRLAPLVTFVVASSSFTVLGMGAVVWSLVAGLAVAGLVESAELRELWGRGTPASA